jgi:hypothetical protein
MDPVEEFRRQSSLTFLTTHLPLRFTLADAVAAFAPSGGHGPEAGRAVV